MRRTLRSLGEGGWKGFGEFRKIPRSFAPGSFIVFNGLNILNVLNDLNGYLLDFGP